MFRAWRYFHKASVEKDEAGAGRSVYGGDCESVF